LTLRVAYVVVAGTLNPLAQKPSAATLAQLFEPIRDDLRQVEREFARHVQSQVAVIPTIGSYIQDGGGKRIRPAVLLMAARMSGCTGEPSALREQQGRPEPGRGAPGSGSSRTESRNERPVLYASVIEFIHTATLVHDDIIDESELRRGRDAVHTRWGNHVTVLFGDFLYLKSMSLALSQDCLDVIRLLCDVTLRIVEGEIYQLTKNGVVDLTEEEHFDIIRRKTAFLFAGSAKIGGMLGATTREQQDALWDYGVNIGMAFQIVDDLLDFTGEEQTLGKPVGGDLREGKMTLPVIHLYAQGDGRTQALLRKIVDARAATVDEWRALRAQLAEARSIEYARGVAWDFVERAKTALNAFPPSDARDALLYLPDYVISRDR
jgi:octaprenyl-diphosphate synthase